MNRFRIAPTPSGYLHAGNEFNFRSIDSWREELGGTVLLRIDDMDWHRVRKEYVEDIFLKLRKWGIRWEMGPKGRQEQEQVWSQSLRIEFYRSGAILLQQTGWLYPCSCSRKALQANACPCRPQSFPVPTSYLNTSILENSASPNQPLSHHLKFPFSMFNPNLPDSVVWRKEGIPAYQLSSLLDDLLFGITHIVRGNDLLPSTEMQQILNFIGHRAWDPDGNILSSLHPYSLDSPLMNSLQTLPILPAYKHLFIQQWSLLAAKLNLINQFRDLQSEDNPSAAFNPFQFHRCTFRHHPLLTDSSGEKLSKSIKNDIPN